MKNTWMIFALLGVAGVSAGYACYVSKKHRDLVKKLDLAVDKAADNVDVKVSESIVNAAINKAVNAAVDKEVRESVSWVKTDIDNRIKQDVKAAIDDVYPEIKPELKSRLEDKLGDIDISSVRKEVVDKAAKKAMKKFDSDLEDVLDNYNNQLKTISSVYNSIKHRIDVNDEPVSFIFR